MALRRGMVIPAHPLALTRTRKFDERRQRALTRYYLDAGAGGIAVGVHTTQFAIHDPRIGLLRPVLELARDTAFEWARHRQLDPTVLIAGAIGPTRQAVEEAHLARFLGYDAVLLSLGALARASTAQLIDHARAVAAVIPVMGFYLQPAVGGRMLHYGFWRQFAEIDNVVAIKIAPFDRYATLDVVRAVVDSGRANQIALYTGNDDHILLDLLTRHAFRGKRPVRMVGGLLGQWACWTQTAVKHFRACSRVAQSAGAIPSSLLALAAQLTDANAAIFDAANGFQGCIPGIHEILRRQGLMTNRYCLDPAEELSPGQGGEIDRVCGSYPHLADTEFVQQHLDEWLA